MIKVPFIEEELTKGIGIISKSKEGEGGGGACLMWRAPIEAPIRGAGVILTDSRNSREPCRGGGEVNREGGWYSMKDTLCKLMSKAHGMNDFSEMRLQNALIGS